MRKIATTTFAILVPLAGAGARRLQPRPSPRPTAPRSSSSATAAPRAYRPEHTLAAYELADPTGRRLHRARPGVDQGRRAGRPARERNLRHHRRRRPRPSSRRRKTTKVIDGAQCRPAGSPRTSRLAELKTLRAVERLPALRPAQHRATTASYQMPTFQEVLDLAEASRAGVGNAARRLPRDQAPDLLQLDRAAAGGAADRDHQAQRA